MDFVELMCEFLRVLAEDRLDCHGLADCPERRRVPVDVHILHVVRTDSGVP